MKWNGIVGWTDIILKSPILDKIDLNILATLAMDCRTSYSSIGSQIGLTSKSVKSRVKNMMQSGIIEKFIVMVNPTAFGYRTAHVLVSRNDGITKEDVIDRIKQFGDLVFHVHHMGRTSMAAVIIKEPWDDKIVKSLNDLLKPAIIKEILVFELPISMHLSETDLRIIKCLLQSGARLEISEIAKQLRISEKTTYVQFVILINVERSYYRNVYERMYSEFQENIILYHPSIIDPDDLLIFVLFSENVFIIDSVLAQVDSFEGVKNADVYIVTEKQYHNDWIMKEIDECLLLRRQRQLSYNSIKAATTPVNDVA